MDEKNEKLNPAESSEETAEGSTPPRELNAVEKFYENFRGIPLKYLDIFIAACLAGFVITVVVGILRAKGIL